MTIGSGTQLDITRRKYLVTGSAVGGSLLAGCTGSDAEESTDEEPAEQADESYSVSIEPMGDVAFDGVPETWVAGNGSWADMGVALGLEPPEALWIPSRYPTQLYDSIDGVSVDTNEMTALWDDGVSKELFYELDADVHVFDPNFLMNRFSGWKQEDVDEISTNIAPVFGNTSFTRGYAWHDDYQYYSLYEAFEKLSQVFQREGRYEAFVELHDHQRHRSGCRGPTCNRDRLSAIRTAGEVLGSLPPRGRHRLQTVARSRRRGRLRR